MLEPETILSRATGFLSSLTYIAWLIVVGALALLLTVQTVRIDGFWFLIDGYKDRLEKCENATAKVFPRARKADEAARGAVDGTQGDVEAGNQRARDAAAGSDDPLRVGLKELGR